MSDTDATTASSRPSSHFSFPRAAQPEIVRAFQKDIYYRDLLRNQFSDVVRSLFGSRTLQANAEVVSLLGSLTYFVTCTIGGGQTLGEEYVNAMMTESKSGRIVGVKRRMSFIVLHVLVPYILSRTYSAFRRLMQRSSQQRAQALQRARLRAAAVAPRRNRNSKTPAENVPQPSRVDRLVSFLARQLPGMEDIQASDGWLAYLGALHLAIFYLGSRYYSLAQRLSGVTYISAIARQRGAKPPSYEVLGVLLGVQLIVKSVLSANTWRKERAKARREQERQRAVAEGRLPEKDERDAQDDETVRIDAVTWSHKSTPAKPAEDDAGERDGPVVPLAYPDPDAVPTAASLGLPSNAPREQIESAIGAARTRAAELEVIGQSILRCTLCMDQREPHKGTSAVTECGHVFCWECIVGWTREKPECPLCRQSINPSHILPVYNF